MLNNYLISANSNVSQSIVLVVLVVILAVIMVVWPMLSNRRRNKALNELNASLRPGDIIKTVGGIIGKIIDIRDVGPNDKEMVIETGVDGNKTTLVLDIQAIYQVVSKVDAPAAEEAPVVNTEVSSEEPAVTEEVKIEEPTVAEETVATEEAVQLETAEETVASEEPKEKEEAPKKPRKGSSKK